jgi:long-chain acyl-CoA synthetase
MTEHVTVAGRVREWAQTSPDVVALRHKELGIWRGITWAQYWEVAQDVAHAYLALGVEVGDRVAIHSENRPEWLFCEIACNATRSISVGIYPTNPTAETEYLLRDSGARIHVAEDQEQVDKALGATGLPELTTIVYLEPRGVRDYEDPRLMAWSDFLELGRRHRAEHPSAVQARIDEAAPEDVATFIYTSGTTGPPKGAMLTNANIDYSIKTLILGGGFAKPAPTPDDLLLSYLPLCHVAERTFSVWFNAASGCQIAFAESIETVTADLAEVQPTIFLGVPRIWEKLLSSITVRANAATPLKRWWYRFWMKLADRQARQLRESHGRRTPMMSVLYWIGYIALFRALQDRIGLRRCRFAASGAAPIAPEVLLFFMGIGVPMHEVYGMTENLAIATANRPGRVKVGTVGQPHEGIELRLDEGTGEVLVRHPGVFPGYWHLPDATAAAVDAEGWLHTGDVGEWVDGGFLRITDRMKDIIITAGGKNISPSEIENAIRTSPYVKEAVVIGDRRPYLTALIEVDVETMSDWALQRQLPYTTYRDLTTKQETLDLVEAIVRDVNERFARVEQIKKYRLLPKQLDHEDGDLTATQKVKRQSIETSFRDLVDSMYGTDAR